MDKYDKIMQVEEIENIINQHLFTFGMRGVANALYEEGYKKPSQEECVISWEEYNSLEKKHCKEINKAISRELLTLKECFKLKAKEFTDLSGNKIQAVSLNTILSDLDEIIEDLKVDLGE